MKRNYFSKKPQVETQLTRLVEGIQESLNATQILTPQIAKSAISTEHMRDDQRLSLESACEQLSISLEAIATQLKIEKDVTPAQLQAGVMAGIMAGDYKGTMSAKISSNIISTESQRTVNVQGFSDVMFDRAFSLEAYDERENKNAAIFSIAYNYQSARQDEFGETLFPTIVVSPNDVGLSIVVKLMMVFDGVTRNISGVFEDFNRKNIIRAVADPTVLHKEQTRIVPVFRSQSENMFVDNTVIPEGNIILDGVTISTAPLAIGKKLDLLGISQTAELVAAGTMDQTDSIDPSITLKNVYVKFSSGADLTLKEDIIRLNTLNLPLSNFTYSTQDNYRKMQLNFTTTSVLINKDTKQNDASALDCLAGVVTNDVIIRLELALTGSVNIETGETQIFGNVVAVSQMLNASGDAVDVTQSPYAAINTIINTGIILGYDLQAYRTNMNRRQRGQLINVTEFTQSYTVPLRSPITTQHPINTDGQGDSSDVQALITATRIRTSNEAVTALINSAQLLIEYIDARDSAGNGPDLLGVGRFFVKPVYAAEALNMNVIVDSLTSTDRPGDIQAALVNKIRDHAYRMYRDSEYKAAADAFSGGLAPVPTVIVATDPVLARYINVTGDLRTLGNEFNVRVVSTLDYRINGKIFITFGVFDESRNTAPNPLNFGNMAWSPELVLTANISRDGGISKETVVQPRFTFITNLPILAELTVTNVEDLTNKAIINFKTIP